MMPPAAQHQTLELFAGIGLVLIIASLVGALLKRGVAHGRPNVIIDNLNGILAQTTSFLFDNHRQELRDKISKIKAVCADERNEVDFG